MTKNHIPGLPPLTTLKRSSTHASLTPTRANHSLEERYFKDFFNTLITIHYSKSPSPNKDKLRALVQSPSQSTLNAQSVINSTNNANNIKSNQSKSSLGMYFTTSFNQTDIFIAYFIYYIK